MDVLGSIWNLLTTENEHFNKLIVAPTIFIEAALVFQLFTAILNINYTQKQEILYITIFSSISLITEFFVPNPFNIFINYITMFIIIKIVFRLDNLRAMLAIIIPAVIFALIVTLTLNPILKFFKITSDDINNTPIYKLTYYTILYSFIFILGYLLHSKKLKFILIEDLDKNNKIILLTNLILGIITVCAQSVLVYFYINILPVFITVLNFILLLAYFIISFYSLTRIIKLQITTRNLENAENYNNTLSYLYDNVKAFHHDFDNMLFIIGGFIDNNDIDGLKKYYKNLEKDGERVNNIALLNPKLINNSGIYNLLMSKYKKANDLNIEIKLDFFFDFEKLHMPIYEFSRIFGILLDNAIEAAAEATKKQIIIMFRDSTKNQTQIISIENTYNNKDVDKNKIFEKGITGKTNHTGMGLWEVNQILRRHNNVVLNTDNDDKYFRQTLEIYY